MLVPKRDRSCKTLNLICPLPFSKLHYLASSLHNAVYSPEDAVQFDKCIQLWFALYKALLYLELGWWWDDSSTPDTVKRGQDALNPNKREKQTPCLLPLTKHFTQPSSLVFIHEYYIACDWLPDHSTDGREQAIWWRWEGYHDSLLKSSP